MKRDYRELRQLANAYHDRFSELNYDSSMSLLQKFNILLEHFKAIAKDWEAVLAYLKEFEENFDENLYDTVTDIFNEWLASGVFDKLIADVVLKIGDIDSFRPQNNTVMDKMHYEFIERGVNINYFGAKTIEESAEDQADLIQQVFEFAYSKGYKVVGSGIYNVSKKISARCSMSLHDVTFIYKGNTTCLQVGTHIDNTRNLELDLPSIKKEVKTWGVGSNRDESYDCDIINDNPVDMKCDLGLKLVNIYESDVRINLISDFFVGVLVTASNNFGNVYNNYNMGHLENNKTNLLIRPSDETGWCNENLFIGGRYSHRQNEIDDTPNCVHIKLYPYNENGYNTNNNVFIKPSVEGSKVHYTLDLNGGYNSFYNGRYEGANKIIKLRTVGQLTSRFNSFIGGYNLDGVKFEIDVNSGRSIVEGSNTSMKMYGTNGINEKISNLSSNNFVLRRVTMLEQDILSNDALNYVKEETNSETRYKAPADQFPRIIIKHTNGEILMGNGTKAPFKKLVGYSGTDQDAIVANGLRISSSTFSDDQFAIGNYRIWYDATNRVFRYKNSKPTSEQDGNQLSLSHGWEATRPTKPVDGDQFLNKTTMKLENFYNGNWYDAMGNIISV